MIPNTSATTTTTISLSSSNNNYTPAHSVHHQELDVMAERRLSSPRRPTYPLIDETIRPICGDIRSNPASEDEKEESQEESCLMQRAKTATNVCPKLPPLEPEISAATSTLMLESFLEVLLPSTSSDGLQRPLVFVQDLERRYLFQNEGFQQVLDKISEASLKELKLLCQTVAVAAAAAPGSNKGVSKHNQRVAIQNETLREELWDITLFPIHNKHALSGTADLLGVGGIIQVSKSCAALDSPIAVEQEVGESKEEIQVTIREDKREETVDEDETLNLSRRDVLNASQTPAALVDCDGTVLDFNSSFLKQRNEQQLPVGLLWKTESTPCGLQKHVKEVFRTGGASELEMKEPEGDRWINCRISPVSRNGTVRAALVEKRDITQQKQTQFELEDYRTQFRQLFQNLPIAYCMCEIVTDENNTPIDFVTIDANKLSEEMTGLTLEDCIGRPFTEVCPGIEKDPADWIGRFGRVAQKGNVHRYTQYSERLSRWFDGVAYRVPNPKSSAPAFVALFTDSSEKQNMQEAARESEERHQTLFENMQQGVVYHYADGRSMEANESALRILGLTMDQLVGKETMDPRWKFIREDGSVIPVEEYPAVIALSGKPVVNMIMGVFNAIDEDFRWISIDAMPRFRPSGEVYQCYTIFNEITKSKQLEQNLLRAKEKAEEADQLKSAFLATMSHEIRTPLNAIMGHLELIVMNGLNEESREENLEGVRVAMKSGKLLISIIEDILDLSKIEAGQLDIVRKPISVRELVDSTVKLAKAYRMQKKQDHIDILESIDARVSDAIYGDQFRVQQVLNNLLSNAIKFTEKGSISFSVRLSPDDPTGIEFSVQDSGKGIPEDRMEIIFEPFRQVEFGDTRKHGGTGLGLTICKKLIEMMGGSLKVESGGSGNGSRFYFILPYEPAKLVPINENQKTGGAKRSGTPHKVAPTNSGTSAKSDSGKKKSCSKILLAEDDTVSRKMATRMLEKAGYEVLPAVDGIEAVCHFKEHHDTIDLVLMDVMMPNMDGLEATEKIREFEQESGFADSIPIVALSAGAMKGDKEKGLECGMNSYLTKPVNRVELLHTLDDFINGSGSTR